MVFPYSYLITYAYCSVADSGHSDSNNKENNDMYIDLQSFPPSKYLARQLYNT